LHYFKCLEAKSATIETLSISGLKQIIPAEEDRLYDALDELVKEEALDSRQVHLNIYIPRNKEGKKILKKTAESGYLSSTTYGSIFFALILLGIGIHYYPLSLPVPEIASNNYIAYKTGVVGGVIYSIIFGLSGGFVIQRFLSRFRQFQLLSEETYVIVARIIKQILVITFTFAIICILINTFSGYTLEQSSIVGGFASIIAIYSLIQLILYTHATKVNA